jgi:chromosome segregation ATPase
MSAINSVNDRILSLSNHNIEQPNRVRQIENNQRQIAHIDKEIGIRTDYRNTLVESRNTHIESRNAWKNYANLLEQNIASNNELISLYKESRELDRKRIGLMERQITLLQESKEIGREKINILKNTNEKLQVLSDRGQGRRTVSAEPRLQNDLDRKLTYLSKQEAVVKEQTALVDAKADKLAIKVEHTEKEIVKLEAKVNNTGFTTPQEKAVSERDASGTCSTYKPFANQRLNNYVEDNTTKEKSVVDLKALEQKVYNSQKNIYESIVSKMIAKLV